MYVLRGIIISVLVCSVIVKLSIKARWRNITAVFVCFMYMRYLNCPVLLIYAIHHARFCY